MARVAACDSIAWLELARAAGASLREQRDSMRVLAQVCAAEVLDFARGRHQIDVRLVISPRASRPVFWLHSLRSRGVQGSQGDLQKFSYKDATT